MFLTPDSLIHYLLQRGYMTVDSVVDGDVTVLETSRRNRNFKVIRKNHPGFFVKQIMQRGTQEMATLQREAACYRLARADPRLADLANLLPQFHSFDPAFHILILELVSGGRNLSELHRRSGKFPTEMASQVAKALGRYHRHTEDELQQNSETAVFPKAVPWVLAMEQQQPGWRGSLSAGSTQVLKVVRAYPQFAKSLADLRTQWRCDALIHGDMKWDNCLTVNNESAEVELKIVDWEMADIGDALWDVGAIMQSYISFWILSMPTVEGATADQMVASAPYPLDNMQAAIRSFWRTYAATAEIRAPSLRESLERSVSFAAARMIQTAVECMTYAETISANVLYLLQVSLNMLQDPGTASRELLGIAEA